MASDPPEGHQTPRRLSAISLDILGTTATHGRNRHGSDSHLEPSRDGATGAGRHPNTPPSYWDQPYDGRSDERSSVDSMLDPTALQSALPPDFHSPPDFNGGQRSRRPHSFDEATPYSEAPPNQDYLNADTVPLTSRAQAMSGSLAANNNESQGRDSFQTVSDIGDHAPRGRRSTLHPGDDIEIGNSSPRRRNFGLSLAPEGRHSRSSSTSGGALSRAGSIVRAMSQRVVNISGDAELADRRDSRARSRSPQGSERSRSREGTSSIFIDTAYHSPSTHPSAEKHNDQHLDNEIPPLRQPPLNPLKGKTLGVFDSENRIRLWLCNILVHPYTEPFILFLIVLQLVLLTVESAPSVFSDGNGRPDRWGRRWNDWAMLGLFIVFTMELIARIIVSGFILNASEYSTIDRQRGIRAAVADQYQALFQPQRHKSLKAQSVQFPPEPSAISRSFTTLMQGQQALPKTFEEQQRFQLARRAFLRHSFNRLDFVAIVSFWISFLLGITGLESQLHLYLFKMLSCLRILRLLALTHGTAVSDNRQRPMLNVDQKLTTFLVRSF